MAAGAIAKTSPRPKTAGRRGKETAPAGGSATVPSNAKTPNGASGAATIPRSSNIRIRGDRIHAGGITGSGRSRSPRTAGAIAATATKTAGTIAAIRGVAGTTEIRDTIGTVGITGATRGRVRDATGGTIAVTGTRIATKGAGTGAVDKAIARAGHPTLTTGWLDR